MSELVRKSSLLAQWQRICPQCRRCKRCRFYLSWARRIPLGILGILEEKMATHSRTLAWKITQTEETGGLQSMGSQRVRHDWETEQAHKSKLDMQWKKESDVIQSCLTLWDPMGCSLPGSSNHGIFQAGIPEWVTISFSRGFSLPRDRTWVCHTAGRLFTVWATREAQGRVVSNSLQLAMWTVALQAPLSMEFFRPEYWLGSHSLLQGSSHPRDWTQVSHFAGGFFILYQLSHQGNPDIQYPSLNFWNRHLSPCLLILFVGDCWFSGEH